MDVFFELLSQLADAFKNPVTFSLVIALIVMSSFALTHFVIKSAKKGGFWATFFKLDNKDAPKPSKELIEIRDKLNGFIASMQAFQTLEDELTKTSTNLKEQLYDSVKKDLQSIKEEILKEITDIQNWMKMHDVVEHQTNQSLREALDRIQDVLNEFIRNTVPEFRDDNKELTRSLSDLSRDIALIERTIQTRIGAVGIKLK